MLWPFLASLPSFPLLALHLMVTCLSLCPCADCRPGALPADTQRLPSHPGHSLWSAGWRHAHLPAPATDLHAAWLPGELSASSHFDAATAVCMVHTLPLTLHCVICQSAYRHENSLTHTYSTLHRHKNKVLLTHTTHRLDSKTKARSSMQHTAETQKQGLAQAYDAAHRHKE